MNVAYFSKLKHVELDGSRSEDVRLMLIMLRKILPSESPSSSCSELSKQRMVNGGLSERKPSSGARLELVTN